MSRVPIPQAENDLLQSEAMATGPWGAGPGITITNNTTDVPDPNGGTAASKLAYDGSSSAGMQIAFQNFGSGAVGALAAIGLWVRLAVGATTIQLATNLGPAFVSHPVDTTWRFYELDDVATIAGGWFFLFYRGTADNAPRSYYVAFAQATLGKNRVGPYAKTLAAPVPGPIRNAVSGRVPVAGRVPVSGRVPA